MIQLKNRNNCVRNNSCGFSRLNSTRKDEEKSKVRRKKNASMDNLSSLNSNTNKILRPKLQTKESDVKKKILGVKEQIRKEKEQLVKRPDTIKIKKQVTTVLGKKIRH